MSDDRRQDRGEAGRDPYVCPAKHAGWLTIPGRGLINDPRRILDGLVKPGDIAVDLGCGSGFFTLPLAEVVGGGGRVIAVDLQAAMLERMQARAAGRGLDARITPHLCTADSLGLDDLAAQADFALAFWMVHEVPDRARLLAQVYAALKADARLLVVEPRGHVGAADFASTVNLALEAGFAAGRAPRVRFSRAALLAKP